MLFELLLPGGLVVALDQLSKTLVLQPGSRIRTVSTRRVGLGLVRDPRALVLLWAVAVAGIVFLVRQTGLFQELAARSALGAAIGGATGNLLDTLRRGAVVDFIDIRIWPIFNVADAAIVSGVAVALWFAF